VLLAEPCIGGDGDDDDMDATVHHQLRHPCE
jgi:hypothetical protein